MANDMNQSPMIKPNTSYFSDPAKKFTPFSAAYPSGGEYNKPELQTPEAQRLFFNKLGMSLAAEGKQDWANKFSQMYSQAVKGVEGTKNPLGIYAIDRFFQNREMQKAFEADPRLKRTYNEFVGAFPKMYSDFLTQRNAPTTPYIPPQNRQALASASYTPSPTSTKGVQMYTNPAGPRLVESGTGVGTNNQVGGYGGAGFSGGSPVLSGGAPALGGVPSGFDANKSRREAAMKLKAESDAEFAARIAQERALFEQRVAPLERQMAGMPEQLAAKEFQAMRQAFQNLADRGMLNSGQNWLAQNEAARASNEALGAAQQAYLEKVSGLQDQYRTASQNLLDKQATRDLAYFTEQLQRQEQAKLDEITKIQLQNEGRIAVANINAASRTQVADIRARASAIAKASSPSGAPNDVSKDYLTILQRAGRVEADFYFKRYKAAAEAFNTYSKTAKQDPAVRQRLYDEYIKAGDEMNKRALVTNTGVTSLAARPFVSQ